MKRQPTRRSSFAVPVLLSALALFFAFRLSANAQSNPEPVALDGLWLTDGYGKLLEFDKDKEELHIFEITKMSCIFAGVAKRRTIAGSGAEIVFVDDDGDVYRVSPGRSRDIRWLHEDGSVSSVDIQRTTSQPDACRRPQEN